MLKFQQELEEFIEKQINEVVEQKAPQFSLLLQYDLGGEDPSKCLIEYLHALRKYNMGLLSHNESNLMTLFSQSFIPTCTPLLQKHPQVAYVVYKINYRILHYFKKNKGKLNPPESKPRFPPKPTLVTNHDLSQCLCVLGKFKLYVKHSSIVTCILCQLSYHSLCVRCKSQQYSYVCPTCVITKIDLMHQVQQTLLLVPFCPKKGQLQLTSTFSLEKPLEGDELIEIRCIHTDESMKQITAWPDVGELVLNGKRIVEFRPLPVNSATKQRKDESFSYHTTILGNNTLAIKQETGSVLQRKSFRITQEQQYLLGVFIIKKYTSNSFIKHWKQNPTKWVSSEQMKDNIYSYTTQNSSAELTVQNLSVSLQCQIDLNRIATPCRGLLCEHIQCFSLENFCKLMETVRPRKWECLVCKKVCLDLVIDKYQLAIIDTVIKQKLDITTVQFDTNGGLLNVQIDQPDDLNNNNINNRNLLGELLYYKQQSKKPITIEMENQISLIH